MPRHLLPRLAARLGCEVLCLGYGRADQPGPGPELGYTVIPQGAPGSAQDNLPRLLAGRQGATVVTLDDAWALRHMAGLKAKVDFRWIAYVPVDERQRPNHAATAARQDCRAEVDGAVVRADGQLWLRSGGRHSLVSASW